MGRTRSPLSIRLANGKTHKKNKIMSRSIWKGPFSEIKLPSVFRSNFKIKVWSRRSMILPIHLEKNFQIYNGKRFIGLKVSKQMVGHKFGEFALTRKRPIHKINKIRQNVKRKK